jgi:diaminopimelate epimerase
MGETFPVNHMELGHGSQAAPHTVVFLEKSDWRPLETLAPFARALQKNASRFPDGTNVNFLKILGHGALEVYTYERGVDEFTLSCGTGSIAAAVAAWLNGWCDSPVEVYNPGGTNTIIMEEIADSTLRIKLRGTTAFIAEGSLYPDGL